MTIGEMIEALPSKETEVIDVIAQEVALEVASAHLPYPVEEYGRVVSAVSEALIGLAYLMPLSDFVLNGLIEDDKHTPPPDSPGALTARLILLWRMRTPTAAERARPN